MSDVALLWFRCKNPDCDYIPLKTKKEKVKKYWRYGDSIANSKRQRVFLRYVEGFYINRNNGDLLLFECKYGTIVMYDKDDKLNPNDAFNPIEDKQLCNPCIEKIENEKRLLANNE